MRAKIFFFVFLWMLFFCHSAVVAQQTTSSQPPFNLNYIPPSASASALGKFGDIPVSLYTGVPNISIPVYNYKGISNGLSMNVSLDYHAGGVRVEEIGGNIGMGWALNAGGVITRTMRGQPDDLPSNGFIALGLTAAPGIDQNTDGNIDNVFLQNGEDAEQDEFTFNFNGHNGRFVLDNHGNAVIVDGQNIKIRPLVNPAAGGGGPPIPGICRHR